MKIFTWHFFWAWLVAAYFLTASYDRLRQGVAGLGLQPYNAFPVYIALLLVILPLAIHFGARHGWF